MDRPITERRQTSWTSGRWQILHQALPRCSSGNHGNHVGRPNTTTQLWDDYEWQLWRITSLVWVCEQGSRSQKSTCGDPDWLVWRQYINSDCNSRPWGQILTSSIFLHLYKVKRVEMIKAASAQPGFTFIFNAFTSLLFIHKAECQMFYRNGKWNGKCHTLLRSDTTHLTFPDICSNPRLGNTIFGGFQFSVLP